MQFVIRKDQNTFSISDQPDEQPDAKIVERWGGCRKSRVTWNITAEDSAPMNPLNTKSTRSPKLMIVARLWSDRQRN